MWNVKNTDAHATAKNNIQKTWEILLSKAQVPNRHDNLTDEIFLDPTHPVIGVINWCYTADGFVFKILNESSRVANKSKIQSMGPYSFALSKIIGWTGKNRQDINPFDFSSCLLFRGTGLTEPQIEEFRKLAKDEGTMYLYGYTSTSRSRS